jgi:hypothetical protein
MRRESAGRAGPALTVLVPDPVGHPIAADSAVRLVARSDAGPLAVAPDPVVCAPAAEPRDELCRGLRGQPGVDPIGDCARAGDLSAPTLDGTRVGESR